MNLRKINYLNRLARKGKVMLDAPDTSWRLTLTQICWIEKDEDYNNEACWAVYCEEDGYRRELEDCRFFILKEYK